MPTIKELLESRRERFSNVDKLADKLREEGYTLTDEWTVDEIVDEVDVILGDGDYRDFKRLLTNIKIGLEGSPTKRRRTGVEECIEECSYEYLREALSPALTAIPPITELKEILARKPKKPLVVNKLFYKEVTGGRAAQYTKGLLCSLDTAPGAEELATLVTYMLMSELSNAQGEDTNHHAVDTLFRRMFMLAADAKLFKCHIERNVGDSLSLTTGSRYRPDLMAWIGGAALLFKGEEKASAWELVKAEEELASKMTAVWDDRIYGSCPYMLCYALGGHKMKIFAMESNGRQELLLSVDMATMGGKLDALTATMNIIRVLQVMAQQLPTTKIKWGIGQPLERKANGRLAGRVTNEQVHVYKEVFDFQEQYQQFAPPGSLALEHMKAVYSAAQGCKNLVQAVKEPRLIGTTYSVRLTPVGLAYNEDGPKDDVGSAEFKAIIAGVLKGLHRLHMKGFVHRDVRWPNVIMNFGPDGKEKEYVLIDLELASVADVDCSAPPYPLPHWLCADGRTVLGAENAYSIVSDLKMVGKELLGTPRSRRLDGGGQDLMAKLEAGEYADAASALAHEWFGTI